MNPTGDINNPYLKAPSSSNPYIAGSLKNDYVMDGVNAVNFYRFITGLPYDVASTDKLNAQAQYGSVLLAAEGDFSHEPERPSDMPKDFYDKGLASTSTANIYGSFGYDNHILVRSIDAYMEDSDEYNLDRLGHRRWILNPPLKQIGLGLAKSSSDDWTYSALQVFDQSRSEKISFNYIAYPAPGAFPIEVFKSNYAWSVSINPQEYAEPSLKTVSVSLKRLRDHKTWSLSSKNNTVTPSGAYFNVENSGYGTGSVIIFRPNGIDEYRADDRFEVTINGLKSASGAVAPLSYTVDFMSAKKALPAAEPDPAAPFNDIAKHWASVAISWAVDNKVVNGYTDGTFRPNNKVSEQEFLTMFVNAFAETVPPSKQNEGWSVRFYDYANDNGYTLQGSHNIQARTMPLSRLGVAELIASAAGQSYTGDEAIQYLLDNNYSKGKTSATVEGYAGTDTLTRAEAVQFIKTLNDAEYHA
jgi:uncharacterized protein YkwD